LLKFLISIKVAAPFRTLNLTRWKPFPRTVRA